MIATAAGFSARSTLDASRVEATTAALFSSLSHLHGLTKTVKPALSAASRLLAQRAPSDAGDELAPVHARLARAAARYAAEPDLAAARKAGGAPRGASPYASVAARAGAVLRIAKSVVESGLELSRVVDRGRAVELVVAATNGSPPDPSAALGSCDLWNVLMPRPLSVVCADARTPADADAIGPADTVVTATRRILQRQIEEFMNREYGLSLPHDVEYVHEMRVATRRIRVAVRLFRHAFDVSPSGIEKDLRWLTAAFGAARDADVLLAFLKGRRGRAGERQTPFLSRLIRSARRARRAHYLDVAGVIESRRYRAFVDGLYEQLTREPGQPGGMLASGERGAAGVAELAPRVLRRDLNRLLRNAGRLSRLAPKDLHRLRIACKKLRYRAEFLCPLYPDRLRELIRPAVRMQRLLGDVHDADVYAARIEAFWRRCGRGSLKGGMRAEMRRLLADLQARRREDLKEAEANWLTLTTAKTRRRLREIIEAPRAAAA